MDKKYCQNCGAQLQPGDRFCEKCGHAVIAEPEPVAQAPAPHVETTAARRKSRWGTILTLLVLLLAGGAAWYYLYPKMRPAGIGAGTGAGPGAWQVTRKPADFAGTWVFTEENSSSPIVVTMREDQGSITGIIIEGDTTVTMEFTDFMGGKLSGTAIVEGRSTPVTAELSSDGNQLILTAEDPPGEFQTIRGTRQGTSPAVRAVPRAPRLGPNANLPTVSSRTEAISIVQELPEVRDWTSRIGQSGTRFDVIAETGDYYTVSASEAPSGRASQGITFGTYNVDKRTGKVYSPPF